MRQAQSRGILWNDNFTVLKRRTRADGSTLQCGARTDGNRRRSSPDAEGHRNSCKAGEHEEDGTHERRRVHRVGCRLNWCHRNFRLLLLFRFGRVLVVVLAFLIYHVSFRSSDLALRVGSRNVIGVHIGLPLGETKVPLAIGNDSALERDVCHRGGGAAEEAGTVDVPEPGVRNSCSPNGDINLAEIVRIVVRFTGAWTAAKPGTTGKVYATGPAFLRHVDSGADAGGAAPNASKPWLALGGSARTRTASFPDIGQRAGFTRASRERSGADGAGTADQVAKTRLGGRA